MNSKDKDLESKNQITNNEIKSEINNKEVVTSNQNDLNKEINQDKIDDNNSNSISKNSNLLNLSDESASENASNIKTKKEIPIEKKPFNEFVNDHLLPSLINEFKERGFNVEEINLKRTSRPIAGDECWVINCEIKDICCFWLSFDKDDISSLKSISLCKSNQKPSVIESFLIDEKRITLKLIISRIFQRLNGQKLLGGN